MTGTKRASPIRNVPAVFSPPQRDNFLNSTYPAYPVTSVQVFAYSCGHRSLTVVVKTASILPTRKRCLRSLDAWSTILVRVEGAPDIIGALYVTTRRDKNANGRGRRRVVEKRTGGLRKTFFNRRTPREYVTATRTHTCTHTHTHLHTRARRRADSGRPAHGARTGRRVRTKLLRSRHTAVFIVFASRPNGAEPPSSLLLLFVRSFVRFVLLFVSVPQVAAVSSRNRYTKTRKELTRAYNNDDDDNNSNAHTAIMSRSNCITNK